MFLEYKRSTNIRETKNKTNVTKTQLKAFRQKIQGLEEEENEPPS